MAGEISRNRFGLFGPARHAATTRSERPVAGGLPGANGALVSTALLLSIGGIGLVAVSDIGWAFVPLALALFLPIAIFVRRHIGEHPHRRFGPANLVTLMRGGMAAAIGAFLGEYQRLGATDGTALLWALVATALMALALDGFDGMLARRTNLASPFGARFDMETDAFLILILCALAFAIGKAGAFVFLIGLMRYGFVLWSLAEPRLRAPLAPSLRRKTVCVLQIASLCLILLPPVPAGLSNGLAGAALALLIWSFAIDVWALLRRPA